MEAQARFSEEILSSIVQDENRCSTANHYRQAKYDSQNLLNIATQLGLVNLLLTLEGVASNRGVTYHCSSMMQLRPKAFLSLGALTTAAGSTVFVSAGTLHYWQAWAFLSIFVGGSLLITLYLVRRDPALLQRRLHGGPTAEKQLTQKIIMMFATIGFVALLVVPGLDYRFGWSTVPLAVVLLGDCLVVVGLYFIFLVYKQNTFASATIEVTENQQVISTGPYALVRHPMYASALLYLFGMPLALASYWGVLAFVLMLPLLVGRLLDEEKLLAKSLPGYGEYQQRVRYRLLPHVW